MTAHSETHIVGWEDHPFYQNCLNLIGAAGEQIDLDPNVLQRLAKPRRVLYVSIPVRMDDGTIQVFDGFRVQHNTTLGPAKGVFDTIPRLILLKQQHSPC